MTGEGFGCRVAVAVEPVAELEAAWIEAAWLERNGEGITAGQWPQKVCTAVDDRQCDLRAVSWPWEDLPRSDAEALQAFLVGLMAPAQQLRKMHHAGGVSLAEAHGAAQAQPVVWILGGIEGGRHGAWIGAR